MKIFVVLCVVFVVACAAAPADKTSKPDGKPEEGARNKRNLYGLGWPYAYSAYPAYSPQVVSYNSLYHVPNVVSVPRVYHVPEVVSVNHLVHQPAYTAPILYK